MKVRSSPSSDDDARYSLYGAFAFGSIILTCFAGFFFTRRYHLPEENVLYTFALGAVYAVLGVLSNHCMRFGGRAEIAYFAVQCSVLTAMIFLSPIRGFFGLIVLPIASQAIFVFRPLGAATICLYLFTLSVSLWGLNYGWGAALEASTNYLAGFSFTIIFTIFTRNALVAREISEKLRHELEAANDQLRAQATQTADLATTRERNRVAREIHDGLGHYLTVVKTQLDAAAALIVHRPDEARATVLKAATLTGDALDDVRRSVSALRTDAPRLPLPEALRALAAESGLSAIVRLEGRARPVPPGIEHALFRSAQEALTNIRKHAGAASTEVLLDFRAPGPRLARHHGQRLRHQRCARRRLRLARHGRTHRVAGWPCLVGQPPRRRLCPHGRGAGVKKLRIMLVDDQSLFREALRTLLALQADFDIVAEAENGERAVALAKIHKPDVILMDLRMPVMGGVEATRRVLSAVPATKVVVLTTFEEDEEIFEAMRAGALGYLLKACSAEKLNESVRAAAKGTSVLEPSVAARMMAELNRLSAKEGKRAPQILADPLSERELGVLRLLADGCSNKEIGSRPNITEGTVKNHMTNVLGKLGVLDRTQAALRAREMGLI